MDSESDRVTAATRRLSRLLPHVHDLLLPHLKNIIEFASKWPPPEDFNPTELYYATQYAMEEAAHLSVTYKAKQFNRAACIGGMAIFFEAFARASGFKQAKRSPSGIADLTTSIWDEFSDAYLQCSIKDEL